MSLCWETFIKEICKELGYVSENGQMKAKNEPIIRSSGTSLKSAT